MCSPHFIASEKMKELNYSREHMVVLTASAMSKLSMPGYALYSSTKAALDSFTDAYRFEEAVGQKLLLVYPVSTATNFFDHAGIKVPVPWPYAIF